MEDCLSSRNAIEIVKHQLSDADPAAFRQMDPKDDFDICVLDLSSIRQHITSFLQAFEAMRPQCTELVVVHDLESTYTQILREMYPEIEFMKVGKVETALPGLMSQVQASASHLRDSLNC